MITYRSALPNNPLTWRMPGEHLPESTYHKTIRIKREVAEKYGLTVEQLLSRSNERRIAWPRQECMWRLRQETKLSLPSIARALQLRDHTTVLWGVRRYEHRTQVGTRSPYHRPHRVAA